jgi:hypothetical protein
MMSEAAIWGAIGSGAAVVALVASYADRRRLRRRDLDAVGFMPWSALFFVALLVACVALGLAAREWLAG